MMDIQIIAPDNICTINQVVKSINADNYSSLSDIHAATFDSGKNIGWVEFKNNYKPNEVMDEHSFIEKFQDVINHWADLPMPKNNSPTNLVVPISLSRVKIDKNDYINAMVNQMFDNGMEYNNDIFDINTPSRLNILTELLAIEAGLINYDIVWRTKGNYFVTFDKESFKEFSKTVILFVENIYKKSWELKEQVSNATTIDEVNAILWI